MEPLRDPGPRPALTVAIAAKKQFFFEKQNQKTFASLVGAPGKIGDYLMK